MPSSQPSSSVLSSFPDPPTSQIGAWPRYHRGRGVTKEDLDHADLIEDAKFYQDAALDYQNAYDSFTCAASGTSKQI